MKTIEIDQKEQPRKKGWILTRWYEKTAYMISVLYFFFLAVALVIGIIVGMVESF